MASVIAISRCAGLNHVSMTVQRTNGSTVRLSFDIADLTAPAPIASEEYQTERVKLMVREAQAAGNTTYAQIRTYLLNRSFVE